MIEGVKIRKLKSIVDYRGRLMELFRSDWPEFKKFGQVYMTTAKPKIAKAWHYHKQQTDSFLCVLTKVKVVLYDSRSDSKTFKEIMEIVAGEENPMLIQIPPFVFHGFLGMAEPESIVFNVPTQLYDYKAPDEFRAAFNDPGIGYFWGDGVTGG
ncbi:MAG: dTDP-4-dehydrorhamnose 3,5-epimerase family protein [bacterium]